MEKLSFYEEADFNLAIEPWTKSEWWHYFPKIEFTLVYEAFYKTSTFAYNILKRKTG